MKLHPIFSKTYGIWWGAMALVGFLKYYFFGIPSKIGYENHGIIFATLGAMFAGLVFGSVLYLVYRLFWKKWDNKIFIILITVMWFIILVAPSPKQKESKTDFGNNVEFKNYTSLVLMLDANHYYHSMENNFRVQIPEEWSLLKGQALGIEFNAVSPDQTGMFSIQIANLKKDEINIDNVPSNFFLDALKSDRVKEMKILSNDMTTIANQKTKHHSLTFSYNHLNENIGYILDSYIFIYKNKAYHLICKEKGENGKIHSKEFGNILASFMLENYE
jgi:hypothetical protein